ncbi:unnamed protein product [Closterium sp. Naga37s-1]|nr:unnamed protein product [Closterium sp. Naga37s-1]
MTTLKALGLFSNYLTGTMPIPSTSLVTLDVGFNFLSGSFPQLTLAVCAADQNCFLNSSYCHTYGTLQLPAAACAICGTTNGQGTLCGGALSTPPQIVLNPASLPILSIQSLLSLKASLGATFTSWEASVPCQVAGNQAVTQATWSDVLCGDTGDVLSISLARQSLKGSIHADISMLTALTYLFFHYNWFAGSIPSFIASLPNLTTLGLFSNYLTGTMPIPSTSLVALDMGCNFLSGSFPQLSLKSCLADHNCFLSSYCRSSGLLERPASACAICGSDDGQGELCYGGL